MFLAWLKFKIWWKVLTSPHRSGLLFLFYVSDTALKEIRKEIMKERRILGSMAGPYGSQGLYTYTLDRLSFYERQEEWCEKARNRACRAIGFVPSSRTDSELALWLRGPEGPA